MLLEVWRLRQYCKQQRKSRRNNYVSQEIFIFSETFSAHSLYSDISRVFWGRPVHISNRKGTNMVGAEWRNFQNLCLQIP